MAYDFSLWLSQILLIYALLVFFFYVWKIIISQLICWHSNTDSIVRTAINHNTRLNMIQLCASIKHCHNSSPPTLYHEITRRLLVPLNLVLSCFTLFYILRPTSLALSSRFLPSAAHFKINDFRTSFPRISWRLKGRSHSGPVFLSLALFLSVVGSLLGFGWWFV